VAHTKKRAHYKRINKGVGTLRQYRLNMKI